MEFYRMELYFIFYILMELSNRYIFSRNVNNQSGYWEMLMKA